MELLAYPVIIHRRLGESSPFQNADIPVSLLATSAFKVSSDVRSTTVFERFLLVRLLFARTYPTPALVLSIFSRLG